MSMQAAGCIASSASSISLSSLVFFFLLHLLSRYTQTRPGQQPKDRRESIFGFSPLPPDRLPLRLSVSIPLHAPYPHASLSPSIFSHYHTACRHSSDTLSSQNPHTTPNRDPLTIIPRSPLSIHPHIYTLLLPLSSPVASPSALCFSSSSSARPRRSSSSTTDCSPCCLF